MRCSVHRHTYDNGPLDEKYRQWGYLLADTAIRQTTVISQEMLRLAAKWAGTRACNRFTAGSYRRLTGSNRGRCFESTADCYLFGTEWAVGLTAGLELGMELAKYPSKGETKWM